MVCQHSRLPKRSGAGTQEILALCASLSLTINLWGPCDSFRFVCPGASAEISLFLSDSHFSIARTDCKGISWNVCDSVPVIWGAGHSGDESSTGIHGVLHPKAVQAAASLKTSLSKPQIKALLRVDSRLAKMFSQQSVPNHAEQALLASAARLGMTPLAPKPGIPPVQRTINPIPSDLTCPPRIGKGKGSTNPSDRTVSPPLRVVRHPVSTGKSVSPDGSGKGAARRRTHLELFPEDWEAPIVKAW